MAAKERVLVPVDGSASSYRALALAAEVASGLGCAIDVVSVLDLSQVDIYDGFYLTDQQIAVVGQQLESNVLTEVRARVQRDVEVHARVLRGRAAPLLDAEAAEPGVRMVFVGRTGKGAFERLVQGSVSRHLAAHAKVPVVVVP